MSVQNDEFIVGQVARLTVTIKTADMLADPTAIRLKVKSPSGSVTTYTDVVRDSIGQYYKDILLTAHGVWTYRFEGDNDNAGADEGRITVKKSVVI